MRIVTHNVHGFRDLKKQAEVIRFARTINCHVLLLQKTTFFDWGDANEFKIKFNVASFF